MVSLLAKETVDDPVMVSVLVREVVEELELESVVLAFVEVMTAPEVVLETPPGVVVLCGTVVAPVRLVAGPLVVPDEVVDVAEEMLVIWDDVVVTASVVVPRDGT